MKCPKCDNQPLTPTRVRNTDVDRCKSCGGIWFDHRELSAVLEIDNPSVLRRLNISQEADELNRKKGECPRDDSLLMRVCSAQNAAVVLDTCPECQGVWLDGGELRKLLSSS